MLTFHTYMQKFHLGSVSWKLQDLPKFFPCSVVSSQALNSTPRHPPRSPLWQALRSPKQAFDSFRQRFRNSSKKALSSKSLASAHDHLAPGTPSYSSNFRHTDRFTDELDEGEMIEERVSWQHRIRHGLFLVRRKWRRMRKNLRMTLSRPRVDIGFILVVAFNLLVLALRYEGAPRKLRRAINGVDVVSAPTLLHFSLNVKSKLPCKRA